MEHQTVLHALLLFFTRLLLVHVVGAYVADRAVFFLVTRKMFPPKQSRSVGRCSMKVIACGFPRSGTASLKLALDHLGFPCYHGSQVFTPGHADLWLQATKGDHPPPIPYSRNDAGNLDGFKGILDGYGSIVGLPSLVFIKELLVAYPHAKVILHHRDPEEWYKSCSRTLYAVHTTLLWRIFRLGMWRVTEEGFFHGKFQGRFAEHDFAISVYKQHFEELKRSVPPEKLLVYESKDGWDALCNFLEVPIPQSPFPRTHGTESFLKNMDDITRVLSMVLALYLAVGAFVIALLFKCISAAR